MTIIAPEFGELIRRAIESRVTDINVAMPGIVKTYDAAKKTATILPALRRPIATDDDDLKGEDIPPIENVPVLSLRSSAFSIEFNLAEGDTVLLVFNGRSPTEWRTSGAVATPGDLRPHGVGYPVAIPGYLSDVPTTDYGADQDNSIGIPNGLRLHWDLDNGTINAGDGADFVAMAAKTKAQFAALKTAISGWSPNAGDGGAALKTALATFLTSSSEVKSSNLKADV